jgi:hypothetical protein
MMLNTYDLSEHILASVLRRYGCRKRSAESCLCSGYCLPVGVTTLRALNMAAPTEKETVINQLNLTRI